ncbi:2,3-diphosphoglycerate-dependent phosphoglycerate mutase [Pelagibacteraceae bacterium]|nr:2,3-diphosphoglycerate-dependent phosphoglycerate mutase [Pelagibacteraceae bacterium]
MNNLILVRHGQSRWNLERRFTGFYDAELTPGGESEAKQAGELIKKLDISFHGYFTSQLKRAINTLDIILDVLNIANPEIYKSWKLNERHYGDLTSFNKEDILKKHGKKQVQLWRRSFDISPPPMSPEHPYKNKIYNNIPKDKMPGSESLKDTFHRVIPYYQSKIKPLLLSKKNILVVFHGNSARALLMKIFNISKEKIVKLEIPTGNPLLIKFGNNLKVQDYKYLDNKRAKKILFNV